MKTNNTMSQIKFFIKHLFYILIVSVWYSNLLFECIEGFTFKESKFIFWIVISFTCGSCYFLTCENRRTTLNAIINVLFSFGIYTFLALASIFKIVTIVSVTLILLSSIMLGYSIFNRRIKRGMDRNKVIKKRIQNWLTGSRVLATCVMTFVIGGMVVSTLLTGNIMFSKTEAVVSMHQETEWTIANNIKKLSALEENRWKQLDIKERLSLLQIVANIESRYLGVETPKVGTAPLSKEVMGTYKDKLNIISIDTEHLRDGTGAELVNTVSHECRHAYQARAVEMLSKVPEEYYNMLMFYDICLFKKGYDTYGDDSTEGYVMNELEIDARKYAKESTTEFMEGINKYIAEGEKNE